MRGTLSDETLTSLKQIVSGTMRATRLVDQLLLMASAENPAGIQVMSVDLKDLAQTQTQQWVERALSKKIDLGFEASDAPLVIKGQALLLAELLNNLIDNALLYTPADGRVTVSVSTTHQGVMLAVEDTGQGIPLAERERVFDRFYRVLGTKADGSGLGLAIVREIALQHAATIRIADSLTNGPSGTGTRIEVNFIAS